MNKWSPCWVRNESADDREKDNETIESEMMEDIAGEVYSNSLKWKRKNIRSTVTEVMEL